MHIACQGGLGLHFLREIRDDVADEQPGRLRLPAELVFEPRADLNGRQGGTAKDIEAIHATDSVDIQYVSNDPGDCLLYITIWLFEVAISELFPGFAHRDPL